MNYASPIQCLNYSMRKVKADFGEINDTLPQRFKAFLIGRMSIKEVEFVSVMIMVRNFHGRGNDR